MHLLKFQRFYHFGNGYVIGIAGRFAGMNRWTPAQIAALRVGTSTGDTKIDALTQVVREAAEHSGIVTDATRAAALQTGWNDGQLTETFAHLGLTLSPGSQLRANEAGSPTLQKPPERFSSTFSSATI